MNFGEVRAFGDFPLYRQAGWDSAQMGKIPFLLLTLGFTVAVFYFEFYLDLRQWGKFFNNPKLPDQLKNVVKAETFEKSIAYRKDTFSFKIFESLFGFGLGIAFVLAGYLPFLWDLATHLVGRAGLLSTSYSVMFQEIVITWLFVILMTLIDTLTSLPFNLYSTFVVEQKHGFNKSTLGLFIQDKLMTLGLTFVISFPVLGAIVYLVRIGGPYFYFYVWFFLFLFSLVMMTIYPTLIAPLFNKYTKLEDGPVKTAIEDLAKQVSFPLTNLFSVDGSKRSGHSNAYFYGFFKNKRIVLYDTLLKQVELPELLAILGHEIGHWKLWHTIQGLAIAQMYTFCLFLAFSYVQNTPGLFVAFGFNYTSPMPVFVGLMLFVQTFWSPVEKVLQVLMTINSRRNEFAADKFSQDLGMGPALVSGLIKISIENLDNLVPDSWYSSYHYSHPPLVERIRAIETRQDSSSTSSSSDDGDKNKKKTSAAAAAAAAAVKESKKAK